MIEYLKTLADTLMENYINNFPSVQAVYKHLEARGVNVNRFLKDPSYEFYLNNEFKKDGTPNPFHVQSNTWDNHQEGLKSILDHLEAQKLWSRITKKVIDKILNRVQG